MTLPLYELEFGIDGHALAPPQLAHFIAESKRTRATDLVFLAHGFRCNAAEATALYTDLLKNLSANLDRREFGAALATRAFAVAGVYWPSQKFPESFGTNLSVRGNLAGLRSHCSTPHDLVALDNAERLLDTAALDRYKQDQFVASVLTASNDVYDDPTEGLPLLHDLVGSDLLNQMPATATGVSEGGICTIPLMQPILGRIDTFLNFMSWTAMKNLSGSVGQNGLAPSLIECQKQLGSCRIHLIGHSLGGRLVTACCKTLAQMHAPEINSLSLLQAAFSHFGFSPDAGQGKPGFFHEVMANQAVIGPMISTFSKQDAVIGKAYAVASCLARDRLQAIGDACDAYGGIGHNGTQRTPESSVATLHLAGGPYRFAPGIVTCLDGSAGKITGHGDVTNPHVTYAIASAITSYQLRKKEPA